MRSHHKVNKHSAPYKQAPSSSGKQAPVVDTRTFVRKRKANTPANGFEINQCNGDGDLPSNTLISNHNSKVVTNKNSYSFFIDINNVQLDEVVKVESRSMDSLDGVLDMPHDSEEEFSSDSLEAEVSWKPEPRRCVSEYEILGGAHTRRCVSEENMLDKNNHTGIYNHISDRHKTSRGNSRESVLTDESEYQYLFHQNNNCKSTESILTDVSNDLNVASECYEEIQKKPVLRTRSLQDTSQQFLTARTDVSTESLPQLIRYFVIQKEIGFTSPVRSCEILEKLVESREEVTKNRFVKSHTFYRENRNLHLSEKRPEFIKPKNESFFIPFDTNGETPNPPEALFKRLTSKPDRTAISKENHPVVAHKPPKPQLKLSTSRSSLKLKSPIKGKPIVPPKPVVKEDSSEFSNENLGTSESDDTVDKMLRNESACKQDKENITQNHITQVAQFKTQLSDLKMPNVRLLSQNFEKSDVLSQLPGSGSSSSCSSPKKLWAPRVQRVRSSKSMCSSFQIGTSQVLLSSDLLFRMSATKCQNCPSGIQ